MKRREFLKVSAGAFLAASVPAALRAAASARGERRLRLGVVSDIHVNGGKTCDVETLAKSVEPLERALRWFDAQDVDAVLIPGDLADMARVPELKAVAETWYRVFPDGKGSDGRPVEQLFLFGNHDSWAHLTKGIPAIWPNRTKVWEDLFHEPYADVRVKTVKGYDFILCGWGYQNGSLDVFKTAVASAGAKGRPFFVAQHPHPCGTCHGELAWGRDGGESTRILSAYPNAVVFSGHSHYVLSDERTVWQQAFTSIGAGSLRYSGEPYDDYPPVGAENTDVASNVTGALPFAPGVAQALNAAKIMGKGAGLKLAQGQQGMLVDLYDEGLVIRRHEFVFGEDLGSDWDVSLPARRGGPFDPKVREKATPSCEFADGATLEVGDGTASTRDGIAHEVLFVTAPAGASTTGAPLVGYDVGYEIGEKFTHLQYVVAADFNLPAVRKQKTMTFPVRKDRLPADARIAVRPVDCFVRPGRALILK